VFVALGIGLLMTGLTQLGGKMSQWQREGNNNLRGDAMVEDDEADAAVASAPSSSHHPPIWLACLAVFAYHMEYVLSFSFVGLVEPITYGTCDALRRLLIIVVGRQMFKGDKFTNTNLGGIFMALLGALLYSITSAKGGGGGGSILMKQQSI